MASKKPLVRLRPPHLAVFVERSEVDGAGGGVSDDPVTPIRAGNGKGQVLRGIPPR
jgi:hypothetical protein